MKEFYTINKNKKRLLLLLYFNFLKIQNKKYK